MTSIDAKSMSAQINPCKTCPFAGSQPINLSTQRVEQLYTDALTFKGSHLCHSADNALLCRGGKDLQIKMSFIFGYIESCTDKAFQAELEKH